MGGEQGFLVLLVVSLVGFEHAIEPGQEFLGAVVAVHDDGATEEGGLKSVGLEISP